MDRCVARLSPGRAPAAPCLMGLEDARVLEALTFLRTSFRFRPLPFSVAVRVLGVPNNLLKRLGLGGGSEEGVALLLKSPYRRLSLLDGPEAAGDRWRGCGEGQKCGMGEEGRKVGVEGGLRGVKEEMSGREAAINSTWRRKVPKGCLQWCMVKEDVMVAMTTITPYPSRGVQKSV